MACSQNTRSQLKMHGWLKYGEVGELYIHGVNGQILMHYAAFIGQEWDEYIQAMKDGLDRARPSQGRYLRNC